MIDKNDYSPLTFTAMKKYIQRIKDSINKSWNSKTSKTKRLIIYGLLLAYMGLALYVIFMPAPDTGMRSMSEVSRLPPI